MKARKKPTVPDGTTAVVEILQAVQVFGNFGLQLALKLAICGGSYFGFEF